MDSYKLTQQIARDAVTFAKIRAQETMHVETSEVVKGLAGLYPIAKPDGTFGIGVHKKYYYMFFQNSGIAPFTMFNLTGKTIPIMTPRGIIFRRAKNVGKPGRINKRDPKTGRILPGNNGVRWRHPGLEPKNFIEYGILKSLEKNSNDLYKIMFDASLAKQIKELLDGK